MVQAGLVEAVDFVGECVGLGQVGGLGEAVGGGNLGLGEPGSELLDAGLVLCPELDILVGEERVKLFKLKNDIWPHLREVVTLLLDLLLQV